MALGTALGTMRSLGIPPAQLPILYGILEIRAGDRPKGLAWIGFSRAHDTNRAESLLLIRSYMDFIRGDASEAEVEAAMRAGESLKLEDILAEAEPETSAKLAGS